MALINFENLPSTNTPINASNLNKIQESNIYSTNEVEIGKWIDNKPIYRKVLQIYNPDLNTWVNHGISNIDNIVDVRITMEEGDGSFRTLPVIYQENETIYPRFTISMYIFNPTTFMLTAGSYYIENKARLILNVIVEYTKTTN